MNDKRKFAIKLLEWYDKNYGMTLFETKDFESVVDDYLSKENRVSDECLSIVLNDLSARKSGRLLKLTDSRRKLMTKLFHDGYELDDFIEVNRYMVKKWLSDDKMRDYLMPETLYASNNFTKYRELAEDEDFEPAANRIRNTTEEALNYLRGN